MPKKALVNVNIENIQGYVDLENIDKYEVIWELDTWNSME